MISAGPHLHEIGSNIEDQPIRRRLRRNMSISLVGSGLSLAAKLAQTVILTRTLRIGDYGRVLVVLNFFVFLDSFFGLRVSDLMFRFFPFLHERRDQKALKGLFWLGCAICLGSAIIIYGGVLVLSPWLADRFYPHLGLTPLLRIYGLTILFSSFSGVYEPVLRIHDRFMGVVVPQVIGSLITLMLLVAYLAAGTNYNLQFVIAAFAIGTLIQSVVPLARTFSLLKPFHDEFKFSEVLRALQPYRREIKSCLVNSNLSGYLKLAISPGDLFLLGLFSSTTQVAWLGLAKQLIAPLAFLQTNIQTAVIPEISGLVAAAKFNQLKRLMRRYLYQMSVMGTIMLVMIVVVGRFLILNILPVEYAGALPAFYLLAIASSLMLAFLIFRPLALNLDLLRWHNLILLMSSIAAVGLILTGRLSALNIAWIQLGEVVILRSLFGFALYHRLRHS